LSIGFGTGIVDHVLAQSEIDNRQSEIN